MAVLVHEVWEEVSEGMLLHACCLAGPHGEACRAILGPGARLLTTFEAGSNFEAMSIYNRYLDREPYTTTEPWDHEPYPEDRRAMQRDAEPLYVPLHLRRNNDSGPADVGGAD